jgi:hypothetical protein
MEANNINSFEGFEKLDNLVFEKLAETPEEKHLGTMKNLGIKVQSVVFPPNFHEGRDEKKFLIWLCKYIKPLHIANYKLRLKYEQLNLKYASK